MGAAFWPLFRLTLNNTFGISASRYRYLVKRERLWEPVLIVLAMGSVGFFFLFAVYQIARGLVLSGLEVGQPEVAFVFASLVTVGLVFFFGLMAVISVFYFSSDLGTLVPLPLTPGSIVLAKFGAILVGEYIGVFLVLGPTALAYAQYVTGGFEYWLSVVIVGLLLPIIPLAVASMLSLVVMRFINRRHRDLMIVLFSLAITALILGFQMVVLGGAPAGDPSQYLQEIMSGQLRLVNLVGRGYPPAIWATLAITASGVEHLAALGGLLGLSALAVWVMGAVGTRFFYGGLIGGGEVARRRLDAREAAGLRARIDAGLTSGSVLRALFLREWRLFMRVPLYVMNGFIASLLVPLIVLIPAASKDPEMQAIIQAINASGNSPFFLALVMGALIVLLVTLNTTAASAVSREGKLFWISKVIPVAPKAQVQGKMLFAAVGALVSAVPTILIFTVALRLGVFQLATALLLGLLGSAVILLLSLLVDLARPYLNWSNPQQAVKSNLNVIIPLPIAGGLIAGLGFLAVHLHRGLGWPETSILAALAGVLVALAAVVYPVVIRAAHRLYERLDA